MNKQINERFTRLSSISNDSMIYLDHAGATLPSSNQLNEYFNLLLSLPLCNPHTNNLLSNSLNERINQTRQLILDFFCV